MKLLSIHQDGANRLGVKTEQGIVDVTAALQAVPAANIGTDVMAIIQGGSEARTALEGYIASLPLQQKPAYLIDEGSINFGPCVTEPSKIICVGLNYRKHAEETKAAIPEFPILFNKFPNTLTGHHQPIAVPKTTSQLDYEAELVIVIGSKVKEVAQDKALDAVFGYCNVNDLSARDLQLRTPQWLLGKTCDDFSPLGPYLVTADEVGNPNNLEVQTRVNGEVRQHSNTSDMIFACDEIVSYISQYMTLLPGDIILTGTPEGVILGYPKEQRVWLKPGDEVSIEIEKLGVLTNRFVADQ